MGKPIDFHIREKIIKDCQQGVSYSEISRKYTIRFNTVKSFHQRFLKDGFNGLQPSYKNCGKHLPDNSNVIFRASCWLKRLHPAWGAPFILIKLKERYNSKELPKARTLQRWFKLKNLNQLNSKLPKEPADWAKNVHDTWQIDAKERIILADGSQGCWLTIVDEKSGATLATLVFPPQPNFTSTNNRNKNSS
jgi:hypothetical protein